MPRLADLVFSDIPIHALVPEQVGSAGIIEVHQRATGVGEHLVLRVSPGQFAQLFIDRVQFLPEVFEGAFRSLHLVAERTFLFSEPVF